MQELDVVVVGAGQAGLSVSRQLRAQGVDHLVLEASRVAQAWRDRWDSFTLVTPNWTLDLPGLGYDGSDPEGHVSRAEIVAYLERYAAEQAGPIREQVRVDRVGPLNGGYRLTTTDGPIIAATVVVCTGAYQRPHRPARFDSADVVSLDTVTYRRPDQVPPGRVLVVGSGQTGCQLAEELQVAGRQVVLSCGRAPWFPRRVGAVDFVTLLAQTPFFDQTLSDLPSPGARFGANVQASGSGGGHDLHYRTLQTLGVELVGHVQTVTGSTVQFADDLVDSVAFGDAGNADVRRLLRQLPAVSPDAPELADPPPFRADPITSLDLATLSAVITTGSFRPDHARWVDLPVFDAQGFPVTDASCAAAPGLYFCGVHFLRRRKSSLLFGVGDDATVVARSIAGHV